MPTRDDEVRRIAAELDARLGELRAVVADLNAILLPPEPDEGKERVVV